jgi:hypothetical protein
MIMVEMTMDSTGEIMDMVEVKLADRIDLYAVILGSINA